MGKENPRANEISQERAKACTENLHRHIEFKIAFNVIVDQVDIEAFRIFAYSLESPGGMGNEDDMVIDQLLHSFRQSIDVDNKTVKENRKNNISKLLVAMVHPDNLPELDIKASLEDIRARKVQEWRKRKVLHSILWLCRRKMNPEEQNNLIENVKLLRNHEYSEIFFDLTYEPVPEPSISLNQLLDKIEASQIDLSA